jgi:DNA-binding MarR family transcriptional regulator
MSTNRLDEEKIQAIAQNCICFNLRRGARAVTHYFDMLFQPYGLRATQFSVLGALALADAQREPLSLTEIAHILVMDRSTLARNLQPLEREGLVEVRLGEDRRKRVALLTSQWDQGQAHFVAELGQTQTYALLQTLAAVVKAAQGA